MTILCLYQKLLLFFFLFVNTRCHFELQINCATGSPFNLQTIEFIVFIAKKIIYDLSQLHYVKKFDKSDLKSLVSQIYLYDSISNKQE